MAAQEDGLRNREIAKEKEEGELEKRPEPGEAEAIQNHVQEKNWRRGPDRPYVMASRLWLPLCCWQNAGFSRRLCMCSAHVEH